MASSPEAGNDVLVALETLQDGSFSIVLDLGTIRLLPVDSGAAIWRPWNAREDLDGLRIPFPFLEPDLCISFWNPPYFTILAGGSRGLTRKGEKSTMHEHLAPILFLAFGIFHPNSRDLSRQERSPVPDKVAQDQAEKTIRELFRAEYAQKTTAGRQSLARTLLQQAEGTSGDPASAWVLLRDAQDLAGQIGDVELVARSAEATGRFFDVDAIAHRMNALMSVSKAIKTAEDTTKLVEHFLILGQDAVSRDDYKGADKAAQAAGTCARKASDAAMAPRVATFSKEVAELSSQYEKTQKAREALSKSPDDPAANLEIGLFLCFVKNAWDQGLPCLAKGSDAALKELAEREAGAPKEGAEQEALGDKWSVYGERQKGPRKDGSFDRTQYWYEQALQSLTGIAATKLEKKLGSLPPGRRPVDLLKITDPSKDSVFGTWTLKEGTLASDASDFARVAFPYRPPAEYDLRVSFSRLEGTGEGVFILAQANHQFAWVLADTGPNCTSFATVKGMWHKSENPTHVSIPGSYVNGRVHKMLVEVRKGRLKATLDGKVLKEWKTDYTEMLLPEFLRMRDLTLTGFASYKSPTVLHRAELLEVSGRGRRLR